MKQINVTEEQYEMLKELSNLIKTQDNFGSENPIYVAQSRKMMPVYDGCDGAGFTIVNSNDSECSRSFEYKILDGNEIYEEIVEFLEDRDFDKDDIVQKIEDSKWDVNTHPHWVLEEITDEKWERYEFDFTWETKAYFLTEQECKRYLKYQSHNLNSGRMYVDYVGYANYGYIPKLQQLLKELEVE